MTVPQMKIIQNYEILSGKNDYHFILASGVFISARNKISKTHCFGFMIESDVFQLSNLENTITKICQSLNCNSSELHLKIVGEKKVFESWSTHFSKFEIEFVERTGTLEIIFSPEEGRIRVALSNKNSDTNSSSKDAATEVKKRSGPLKVLIVDDSKTIRTLLKGIFASSSDIEVACDTGHPNEVMNLIAKHKPDVITLDIHMPEMDGVTLLKKYIKQYPIPTVMITSISLEEGPVVLSALEAGAVDYIKKPEMNELAEASELIIEKIKAAGQAIVKKKITARAPTKTKISSQQQMNLSGIIAIGSSTGGTEALKEILINLPEQIPPILIVQHIPPVFSKAFATRLNDICPFGVKEAEHGDVITSNQVYIAPGGLQMKVKESGQQSKIIIEDAPPVNRHKPSVDYLYDSLISFTAPQKLAIILTGMGNDGAQGLLKLKNAGWNTFAQSKDTCVVFGMPAVAIKLGGAQKIIDLDQMAPEIIKTLSLKKQVA